MSLNIDQFKVLSQIAEGRGSIPNQLRSLCERYLLADCIDANGLSDIGSERLEPYKVKRAILLASGLGSRLLPLTLEKPKPMVEVCGRAIIETLINAIIKAGINEIIIVRGYKAEKFDVLLKKYPQIKFVENPYYSVSNNISSVYAARDFLDSCYIIEADLFLLNNRLIRKYQFTSNYLGIKCSETKDWFLKVDDFGRIKELGQNGEDCYQLVGISYWDCLSALKLKNHIIELFESDKNSQLFWDEVALSIFREDFDLRVRECSFADVFEIDSISDLKKLQNLINKD